MMANSLTEKDRAPGESIWVNSSFSPVTVWPNRLVIITRRQSFCFHTFILFGINFICITSCSRDVHTLILSNTFTFYGLQHSCGKVMFSQASVILFTRRGGCIPACTGQTPPAQCMLGYTPLCPVHAGIHVPLPSAC